MANVVAPLCQFVLSRAERIIVLVGGKRLWDADIIGRSLFEAFVKLAFICCKDGRERTKRIMEYSVDTVEVEDLRRSDRCRQILAEADTSEWHKVLDPLLVPSSEESVLRSKWSKGARTKLEQKWSFLSMLCAIDKEIRGANEAPLGLRALLHGYVSATHFVHADRTSFLLLWDRSTRTPEVREKLEEAHAARLLSDGVWFSFLCWPVMARALEIRPESAEGCADIQDELAHLSERFQTVQAEFWATQVSRDS